jgi:hypothetical protein
MSSSRRSVAASVGPPCASSNSTRTSVSEYGLSRWPPRSKPIVFV